VGKAGDVPLPSCDHTLFGPFRDQAQAKDACGLGQPALGLADITPLVASVENLIPEMT
jgi:hypothetical protein